MWRFIARNWFCYKAYDISVLPQTDISKTNYTAVTVQSSNIHHKQGYDYIFLPMLDIFKTISCNCKFLYLRYNAYHDLVFVILYNASFVSTKAYLLIYLLTYLFTYLLTPRSRVLLEKLTGVQLVKKFSAFYGTRRFITAFTSAGHLFLSWASSIHSINQILLPEDPS